jgi:hypothetical protein
MNKREEIFLYLVIISFVMSFNLKADVKNKKDLLEEKLKKEIKKECVEVQGTKCKVCQDGSIETKNKEDNVTLSKCLKEKKASQIIHGTSVCYKASKFCYACEDGKYLSSLSKSEIESDAYVCSRTKVKDE